MNPSSHVYPPNALNGDHNSSGQYNNGSGQGARKIRGSGSNHNSPGHLHASSGPGQQNASVSPSFSYAVRSADSLESLIEELPGSGSSSNLNNNNTRGGINRGDNIVYHDGDTARGDKKSARSNQSELYIDDYLTSGFAHTQTHLYHNNKGTHPRVANHLGKSSEGNITGSSFEYQVYQPYQPNYYNSNYSHQHQSSYGSVGSTGQHYRSNSSGAYNGYANTGGPAATYSNTGGHSRNQSGSSCGPGYSASTGHYRTNSQTGSGSYTLHDFPSNGLPLNVPPTPYYQGGGSASTKKYAHQSQYSTASHNSSYQSSNIVYHNSRSQSIDNSRSRDNSREKNESSSGIRGVGTVESVYTSTGYTSRPDGKGHYTRETSQERQERRQIVSRDYSREPYREKRDNRDNQENRNLDNTENRNLSHNRKTSAAPTSNVSAGSSNGFSYHPTSPSHLCYHPTSTSSNVYGLNNHQVGNNSSIQHGGNALLGMLEGVAEVDTPHPSNPNSNQSLKALSHSSSLKEFLVTPLNHRGNSGHGSHNGSPTNGNNYNGYRQNGNNYNGHSRNNNLQSGHSRNNSYNGNRGDFLPPSRSSMPEKDIHGRKDNKNPDYYGDRNRDYLDERHGERSKKEMHIRDGNLLMKPSRRSKHKRRRDGRDSARDSAKDRRDGRNDGRDGREYTEEGEIPGSGTSHSYSNVNSQSNMTASQHSIPGSTNHSLQGSMPGTLADTANQNERENRPGSADGIAQTILPEQYKHSVQNQNMNSPGPAQAASANAPNSLDRTKSLERTIIPSGHSMSQNSQSILHGGHLSSGSGGSTSHVMNGSNHGMQKTILPSNHQTTYTGSSTSHTTGNRSNGNTYTGSTHAIPATKLNGLNGSESTTALRGSGTNGTTGTESYPANGGTTANYFQRSISPNGPKTNGNGLNGLSGLNGRSVTPMQVRSTGFSSFANGYTSSSSPPYTSYGTSSGTSSHPRFNSSSSGYGNGSIRNSSSSSGPHVVNGVGNTTPRGSTSGSGSVVMASISEAISTREPASSKTSREIITTTTSRGVGGEIVVTTTRGSETRVSAASSLPTSSMPVGLSSMPVTSVVSSSTTIPSNVPASIQAVDNGQLSLDSWINAKGLIMERIDNSVLNAVPILPLLRTFDVGQKMNNFQRECQQVFPQQTLDTIFGFKGVNVNRDIQKWEGSGLNHEAIIIGCFPSKEGTTSSAPSGRQTPDGLRTTTIEGSAVSRRTSAGGGHHQSSGEKRLFIKVSSPVPNSQGEAVEIEHLRRTIPGLENDPNVCFPIAGYRASVGGSGTALSTNLAYKKAYDITVFNYIPSCYNLKDVCSAFDRAEPDLQQRCYPLMEHLVGVQCPQLFHRFYLKYDRKMGDGKSDNVLISSESGVLYFCDIASTYNSTMKPSDLKEFLRSVQPAHQDSPVNVLKQQFERYFQRPPRSTDVLPELYFPEKYKKIVNGKEMQFSGRELMNMSVFPPDQERANNVVLLNLLARPLAEKGGLLRKTVTNPKSIGLMMDTTATAMSNMKGFQITAGSLMQR